MFISTDPGRDPGSACPTSRSPSPPKPDLAAYNEATAKAGQERRCSGPARALVRGPRPDGRAAQAPVARGPVRSVQRAGAGPDGPGRLSGQVGTARQVSQAMSRTTRTARPGSRNISSAAPSSKDRADDHWKLAVWCEQNGLKEQADAHLHEVLRLDPRRESAWKHLGYKRVGGRWIKPDEAAAAKAEAQQQKKANEHWRPILERLADRSSE